MSNITYNLTDLTAIASKVIAESKSHKIFLFEGEMGAGKTTLIKAVCAELNVDDNVSSPTFGIVNEYYSPSNGDVYHFDFYRLDDEHEVVEIGVEDYFYSGNYCFIEWSSKIPSYIPNEYVVVNIKIVDENTRELELKTYG